MKGVAMSGDVPAMFPFMTADPCAVPGEYARLLREAPVSRVRLPTGDSAWLVVRHVDVRAVLSDPRFSRQALTAPDAPKLMPIPPMPSLFFLDPPRHARVRRLAARAFGAQRIERLRSRVEAVVEARLRDLAALPGQADLMAVLARPLPLAVLATILGIPEAESARFATLVGQAMGFGKPPEEQMKAFEELNGLLFSLIQEHRSTVHDDVLGDLVNAVDDINETSRSDKHGSIDGTDRLDDHEILALVYDLVGAGDQPVTAEIVHAVLRLLREPGLLAALHGDPALVATAAEELLRHSQAAGGGLGSIRVATADVELGGVTIKAGDLVIPSLNAADLDEDVFPDPGRTDLARTPNPHLGYGHGPHLCLGIWVGRTELRAVIGGLAERFPKLRLTVAESELNWTPLPVFRTPTALPVSW
jgi:cytochrome P450